MGAGVTLTQPAPTKLDLARTALHRALGDTLVACGWPADRAHRHAPDELVTPGGYVDVATLHQAPTASAGAVAATFPVWLVVDGASEQQRDALDSLTAHGWRQLSAVKIGTADGRRTGVTVQTAGPVLADVGPARALAVQFRVQCTLALSTLCEQGILPESGPGA